MKNKDLLPLLSIIIIFICGCICGAIITLTAYAADDKGQAETSTESIMPEATSITSTDSCCEETTDKEFYIMPSDKPESCTLTDNDTAEDKPTYAGTLIDLGEFTLTAYCPCEQCCGEYADGITYTGTVATQGRTIGVDPDVIPLGSTVYIDGCPYVAEDIGGGIQGNHIDVFMASHEAACEFGLQTGHVEYISLEVNE